MGDKRTIGQILVDMGRIDEADIATALAYQARNGGYFGAALLACELITEDELEYGLASQFDLPFVFPDADAIDPEAAAIVSPEWALAHLTLPIMMTEDTLTVIVESPLKTSAVDELRARTERTIELALASASSIRELIRQVYARSSAVEEEHRAPIELTDLIDEALAVEAQRFGVSVRGLRATAWWDDRGTIRRRPLGGDWIRELERSLVPGPYRKTVGKLRSVWDAELTRAGLVTPVTVQYLTDESGSEYLLKPRPVEQELRERFPPPPDGVLSEVRLLARSGTARFVVSTDPDILGHEILPHLPTLLLDPTWRGIYLHQDVRRAAGEAFSVMLPSSTDDWEAELESLRAFHFDVVAVDLTGGEWHWAPETLDVASVAFVLWPSSQETRPAYDAGIRWRLQITRPEDGQLDWALEALHG